MSIYRNAVWMLKGMREYTIGGYQEAATHFKDEPAQDLSGQSFMITGANSGIGKTTALSIARNGGTVHMVCRDRHKGEDAMKDIKSQTQNEKIFLHVVDLSKPFEVSYFAHNFVRGHGELNVLVNNAGCMIHKRILSEELLETNFTVNILSPHILTMLLLPILKEQVDSRVIFVSSGGMLTQKLNVEDMQCETMDPFDGTMAYAQHKRQQVVLAQQYANMFPEVKFFSMHPGWVDTEAVRNALPAFYMKMKDKLRKVEQGADTVIWLATSDMARLQPSGLFFQDRQAVSVHLPLAWTKSSKSEELTFMAKLQLIAERFMYYYPRNDSTKL